MKCMSWAILIAAAFAIGLALPQQQITEEAKKKQMEFRQRSMTVLTPEERAHLQSNGKINQQEWRAAHPARSSTGLIPLPELGKQLYHGEEGGLYPGGVNTPPTKHLATGMARAKQIVPLDADGHPSPDGKIVLLSVGMSNTTMKFTAFQRLASQTEGLNPKLVLVDGAQGGQVAWITSKAKAPFWDVVDERLQAAGVTRAQVQAAWVLQANPGPQAGFPAEMKELQVGIEGTLQVMHDRFPNLKVSYLSSRTYAGYATSPLNPEPYSYENGFAVKWTIADQLAGKPEMSLDRVPWVEWGPYLWADGEKPSKSGLSYSREDYTEQDGTHPTPSGRMKVAKALMEFFRTDPTTKGWFLSH